MIKAHESAEPFVTLDGTTLAAQNYRGFCSFLLFGPTRSAIDHHRHSTNTGQCAIDTGGRFGDSGNKPSLFKERSRKSATFAKALNKHLYAIRQA